MPKLERFYAAFRYSHVAINFIVMALFGQVALGQPPIPSNYDIVVYGGTSAAVVAAVQAKRMGKSVVVVCPDNHLGGLSSGGLGWTDTGNKAVIGGLAREFYHRVWLHYDQDAAWRWQSKAEYGNKGQGTPAIDGSQRTMWIFEPHVAEQVFQQLIDENKIPVHRNQWLNRESGVKREANRIVEISMISGLKFSGQMFVDATYEGDLMAAAKVGYTVGRESTEQYGEKWNGVQVGVLHHRHHFGAVQQPISAYRLPGNPSSGLLPHISADPPGQYGAADHRVQAYCFRMCLSNDSRNRVPFVKPQNYDAAEYELLGRVFDAGWREQFEKFDPIPNHKTDTNNHGPFSTDNIGENYDYPEASYERRREIVQQHRDFQQGLMYFMANDPRVPEDVRREMSQWGLAADEFVDNGNWPHQLYIREARRMIGSYVMTENELQGRRDTPESVGMGSYTIDSHNVQRYVTSEGNVQNEGDIGVGTGGPYQIAMGSLLPKPDECENLVVPVCISSSHIAYGSIRMEPVFMILGQSAVTIAAMAIDQSTSVQKVPYDKVRERLLMDGQVLQFDQPRQSAGSLSTPVGSLKGIVVDNSNATLVGDWRHSTAGQHVGSEYLHDGNLRDGQSMAIFRAKLQPGRYSVRVAYSQNANRCTKTTVEVAHAEGKFQTTINQRQEPPIDKQFIELGQFNFGDQAAQVSISNRDSDGYVIADAIQFLPVGQ